MRTRWRSKPGVGLPAAVSKTEGASQPVWGRAPSPPPSSPDEPAAAAGETTLVVATSQHARLAECRRSTFRACRPQGRPSSSLGTGTQRGGMPGPQEPRAARALLWGTPHRQHAHRRAWWRDRSDETTQRGPIPRMCTMPARAVDPALGMLALPTRLLTGRPQGHGGSIPPAGAQIVAAPRMWWGNNSTAGH